MNESLRGLLRAWEQIKKPLGTIRSPWYDDDVRICVGGGGYVVETQWLLCTAEWEHVTPAGGCSLPSDGSGVDPHATLLGAAAGHSNRTKDARRMVLMVELMGRWWSLRCACAYACMRARVCVSMCVCSSLPATNIHNRRTQDLCPLSHPAPLLPPLAVSSCCFLGLAPRDSAPLPWPLQSWREAATEWNQRLLQVKPAHNWSPRSGFCSEPTPFVLLFLPADFTRATPPRLQRQDTSHPTPSVPHSGAVRKHYPYTACSLCFHCNIPPSAWLWHI